MTLLPPLSAQAADQELVAYFPERGVDQQPLFVKHLVSRGAAGIFDGFDIDWEYPITGGDIGAHHKSNDDVNLTALLTEFRAQMGAWKNSTGYLTNLLTSVDDPASDAFKLSLDNTVRLTVYGEDSGVALWQTGVTYAAGDEVFYEGCIYAAKRLHVGSRVRLPTSDRYWLLVTCSDCGGGGGGSGQPPSLELADYPAVANPGADFREILEGMLSGAVRAVPDGCSHADLSSAPSCWRCFGAGTWLLPANTLYFPYQLPITWQ